MEPQPNVTSATTKTAWIAVTSAWISVTSLSPSEIVSTMKSFSTQMVSGASSGVNILIIFSQLCLAIGLIGIVANGAVLFVLFYYKLVQKNVTNKFICNQMVLGMMACVGLTTHILVESAAGGQFGIRQGVSGWIICLVFDSLTWIAFAVYSSQFNLVVIAVERYAMIVHPVAHRKHFRPWMTGVGLIIPWLNGVFIYIIPMLSTTRVAGGRCLSFGFWPTPNMKKAYSASWFTWQTVIPISLLTFCYGKIVAVLRRQALAIGHKSGVTASVPQQQLGGSATLPLPSSSDPPAAALGNQSMTGTSQATQLAGASKSTVSKTERKVIKTMIVVVVFYVVCWFPIFASQISFTFNTVFNNSQTVSFFLTTIAYFNLVANPIIYSAHFDVVRKVWQAIDRFVRRRGRSVTEVTPTIPISGGSHHGDRGTTSRSDALRTATTST